ncbi:hypothetical protein Syun_031277 [Stephania yunnanensis]|uniref:Uncharacterized protein n=1 Tax=Stephania yunnanensis TaxID=152371 RepID=A0AAP0DZV9_9MAGN
MGRLSRDHSTKWRSTTVPFPGLGLGGRGLVLNARSFLVVHRYLPIECTLGALIGVRGCFMLARARAGRQVSRPRFGSVISHSRKEKLPSLKNFFFFTKPSLNLLGHVKQSARLNLGWKNTQNRAFTSNDKIPEDLPRVTCCAFGGVVTIRPNNLGE